MTQFKKGDRVVFVKDDRYRSIEMPKGTLATYDNDNDNPATRAPQVRLDTGECVLAWWDSIAPAEDHGTGDGSASDICAEPGCNCDLERRFPAPLDRIAARRESTPPYEATTNPDGSVTARSNLRFVPDAPQQVEDGLFASANRSLAAALRTGPLTAPIDPAKVKAGDTVTVRVEPNPDTGWGVLDHGPEPFEVTGKAWLDPGDNPHGPVAKVGVHALGLPNVTLTAHTPAPEPEWKPGTVYAIDGPGPDDFERGLQALLVGHLDGVGRAFVTGAGDSFTPAEVRNVRPLVVIDPATVDVKAVGAALSEAVREPGVFLSWEETARIVLAEVGIEVPR